MKQLEKLIIEAQIITEPEAEVERVMQVCMPAAIVKVFAPCSRQ